MRRRMRWLGPVLVTCALLGACSDDSSSSSTSSTTSSEQDEEVTDNTSVAELEESLLDIGTTTTDLGEILVDGEGMTLYVNKADVGGIPTCLDACAQAWPPFVSDSFTVPDGVDIEDFSIVERPDGSTQAAFRGEPLYLFSGDAVPGDTTGQGLNDTWFVVVLAE